MKNLKLFSSFNENNDIDYNITDIIEDTFVDLNVILTSSTPGYNTNDSGQVNIYLKSVMDGADEKKNLDHEKLINFDNPISDSEYNKFEEAWIKHNKDILGFSKIAKGLTYRLNKMGYKIKGYLHPGSIHFRYSREEEIPESPARFTSSFFKKKNAYYKKRS